MVMQVEVVRSARRRKTVQARQVNGVLRVSIPATMTKADEAHWVQEMVRRMERHATTESIDIKRKADQLARRYSLPRAKKVSWVHNQASRWGSCTPGDGTVRISSRMVGYPDWVLSYVLVHELAHMAEPNHSARFWRLVNRYPMAERARGFLIAKGLEEG